MFRNAAQCTSNVAALAEAKGLVCIFIDHRVMVEDFAILDRGADLSAAHTVSAHRVAILDPVDDIQVMDVLLIDMISAEPIEIIPIAHLVFHFCLARLPWFHPDATIVPIAVHGDDISDLTIMQPFESFDVARVMMTLEADADF